jgi:hypothetical protein
VPIGQLRLAFMPAKSACPGLVPAAHILSDTADIASLTPRLECTANGRALTLPDEAISRISHESDAGVSIRWRKP